MDIEQGPELATAPSSHFVAGVQPSGGTADLDDSISPAAQQGSAISSNSLPSSSEAITCSNLPTYTTIPIDAKYYISIDMPMPSHYTSKWEGSIKKLLETSISSSLAIKDDGEAALMLEIYMAGTTKEVLKPSIWITCCSSRMEKKLKSHLKTLRWLKDSGFQYFIRVDKTFGYRTQDSTDINDQTLIEARLPPVSETLCGIPARVNFVPGGVSVESQIEFTIGGLICLDEDFACLTAGHPFLPFTTEDESEIESSESEDTDYSSSSLDFKTEADVIESDYDDQKPKTSPGLSEKRSKTFKLRKNSIPFQRFLHRGILSHFGPCGRPDLEESAIESTGNPDWALLRIGASTSLLLPNKFQFPGNEHPTFVDQIVSASELVKGPVWVVAGSGVRKCILNQNPASIFLRGSFRNVRLIILDESLCLLKPFKVCQYY
jgi:hypothetical protein